MSSFILLHDKLHLWSLVCLPLVTPSFFFQFPKNKISCIKEILFFGFVDTLRNKLKVMIKAERSSLVSPKGIPKSEVFMNYLVVNRVIISSHNKLCYTSFKVWFYHIHSTHWISLTPARVFRNSLTLGFTHDNWPAVCSFDR